VLKVLTGLKSLTGANNLTVIEGHDKSKIESNIDFMLVFPKTP
jgi:hypothetical protein